jgi:hypothetical protein
MKTERETTRDLDHLKKLGNIFNGIGEECGINERLLKLEDNGLIYISEIDRGGKFWAYRVAVGRVSNNKSIVRQGEINTTGINFTISEEGLGNLQLPSPKLSINDAPLQSLCLNSGRISACVPTEKRISAAEALTDWLQNVIEANMLIQPPISTSILI